MAFKLLNRALQVLDRIYDIAGSQVTIDRMDDGPIQPVHDTSREAELNAIITSHGAGGFFQEGHTFVHSGGGTLEASDNPYDSLGDTWGKEGERWIWLMKCALTGTAAAMISGGTNMVVSIGALGQALAVRDFLVAHYGGEQAINGIATEDFAGMEGGHIQANGNNQLPFPVFPGSTFRYRSVANGVVTVTFSSLCWVGPIGVYPPGLR